jgi:hypothetical protein
MQGQCPCIYIVILHCSLVIHDYNSHIMTHFQGVHGTRCVVLNYVSRTVGPARHLYLNVAKQSAAKRLPAFKVIRMTP